MSERKDDSPHEGPGVLVEVSRVVELLFSVGLLALVRFVPPAAEEEWVNRVQLAFFFLFFFHPLREILSKRLRTKGPKCCIEYLRKPLRLHSNSAGLFFTNTFLWWCTGIFR